MSSAARILETPSEKPLDNLDDCRVVAALGRGGMAEVFLATYPHQAGEDLVVIKRLHAHLDGDPAVVAMFLDEACVALQLVHPGIVRSYELGLFQGRHALVMEYLEGQSIQRVQQKAAQLGRDLPCEVVVPLVAEVLDALDYAHNARAEDGTSLGLVHRDVSPHNLFLTSAGNLKLLDFGIAKTAFQECRTRTGLLKGKVSYMAPEQAWGYDIDRRADLWSVGVVLWEMLAGRRLFKADSEAASLHNTLTADVPHLGSVRGDVPVELERIVSRALQRDPALRFPTAAAMAHELRAWAGKSIATARPAARALFDEFFGDEVDRQRQRIGAMLSRLDEVPISGSVPIPRLDQPTHTGTRGASNLSTTAGFVRRVTNTRVDYTRWALLAVVGLLLGVLVFERLHPPPPPQQPIVTVAPTPLPRQLAEAALSAAPAGELERQKLEPLVERSAEPAVSERDPASSPARRSKAAPRRGKLEAQAAPRPASEATPVVRAAVELPASGKSKDARAEFGYLTIDSSPWANVSAGGVPLGQTPIVRAKLPSGTHTLVLTNPDQNLRTSYPVRIEPGKTTVRRVGLE